MGPEFKRISDPWLLGMSPVSMDATAGWVPEDVVYARSKIAPPAARESMAGVRPRTSP